MFLPNSKADTTFELHKNKVNGIVEIDDKGIVLLDLQTNRSNPRELSKFMKELIPPRIFYSPLFHPDKYFDDGVITTTKFNIKFKRSHIEKRAKVAVLRIAYLMAYATFGNGFYINRGLYKVREQISNPDKEILPPVFWIKYDFPKRMEGINIITLPKELRCFLVIFYLRTKSQERQFAIVLPGPSDPGINVYAYIDKELCVGDGTKFINGMIEHIPQNNYLKNKDYAFASHWFWQEYSKPDYKPNLSD